MAANARYVVAARVFVHVLFTFRTLLGDLLDRLFRLLLVLSALAVALVVFVAGLSAVPLWEHWESVHSWEANKGKEEEEVHTGIS